MIARALLGAGMALVLLHAPAGAQSETADEKTCNSIRAMEHLPVVPDAAIAACTRAIAAHRGDRVWLLYNARSWGYAKNGDFERAFADNEQLMRRAGTDHIALIERAAIWVRKNDIDRAITDYTEAVRKSPKDNVAYAARGTLWAIRGEWDRVIAGASEYLAQPDLFSSSDVLVQRGLAYFYSGESVKALADLNAAVRVNKSAAILGSNYEAIFWHEIVSRRSNLPSQARRMIGRDKIRLDSPLRLVVGEMTQPQLEAYASSLPNPDTARSSLCLAYSGGGLWARQQGNQQDAIRLFRRAMTDCPSLAYALRWGNQDRYWVPALELKALGAPVPERQPPLAQPSSAPARGVTQPPVATPSAPPPKDLQSLFGRDAAPTAPPAAARPRSIEGVGDASPDADCSGAETHWKAVDALGVIAAYEDHLARFPSCAYSTVAKLKIEALRRK